MHQSAWRVIDANTNRALEGLRVLEDIARLVLGDAQLAQSLKVIRHDLAAAIELLDSGSVHRLAARDSASDVGTTLTASQESIRPDWVAVAIAAGKRAQQALRVLEECVKLLGPSASDAAHTLEQCRYLAYDAERDVVRSLPSLSRSAAGHSQWHQPRVCVLLTKSLCAHHSWQRVAELAIEGGATCIQLREKAMPDRELLSTATQLVAIAHSSRVPIEIIINDRPDIALLSGAAGVHLGQADLPVSDVRQILSPGLAIGVSTANLDQAAAAVRAGADYLGLGPMFPTSTKHIDHLATPAYVRAFVEQFWSPNRVIPFWAIGGICPENAHHIAQAVSQGQQDRSGSVDGGWWGVAVSRAVCEASEPDKVCNSLVETLASNL